jgi:hypothetical protein
MSLRRYDQPIRAGAAQQEAPALFARRTTRRRCLRRRQPETRSGPAPKFAAGEITDQLDVLGGPYQVAVMRARSKEGQTKGPSWLEVALTLEQCRQLADSVPTFRKAVTRDRSTGR